MLELAPLAPRRQVVASSCLALILKPFQRRLECDSAGAAQALQFANISKNSLNEIKTSPVFQR
jgi:hypothetical protein